MSLSVTPDQIERAAASSLTETEFIAIIRTSLPEAFATVASMAGSRDGAVMPPAADATLTGQLLRLLASTSMRTSLERHFNITGLRLATPGLTIDELRSRLPYAYEAVERLAKELAEDADGVVLETPLHMEDALRLQLLEAFASFEARQLLERHFGISELGFQNCHYIGGASDTGRRSPKWERFVSREGQVLAQRPELRDC